MTVEEQHARMDDVAILGEAKEASLKGYLDDRRTLFITFQMKKVYKRSKF